MTALQHSKFKSPLGLLHIITSAEGVCLIEFSSRPTLQQEFADLERLLNLPIVAGENAYTQMVKEELSDYFAGKLKIFSTPVHIPGTEFQQQVWQSLQTIPYGETISYSEQAKRMGRPTASRAVAGTNGKNRISIVIPCHRVIGKNGTLTGYGGGLERKKWLLEHERKYKNEIRESLKSL